MPVAPPRPVPRQVAQRPGECGGEEQEEELKGVCKGDGTGPDQDGERRQRDAELVDQHGRRCREDDVLGEECLYSLAGWAKRAAPVPCRKASTLHAPAPENTK